MIRPVAVIVAYIVVNFVIQSVIQPQVVGDAVGLATTLTFLSLVFWTWLIGPLGAVLAVPLTLLVKALLVDIDPSTRWLAVLISSGSRVESASGLVVAGSQPEPTPTATGRQPNS